MLLQVLDNPPLNVFAAWDFRTLSGLLRAAAEFGVVEGDNAGLLNKVEGLGRGTFSYMSRSQSRADRTTDKPSLVRTAFLRSPPSARWVDTATIRPVIPL